MNKGVCVFYATKCVFLSFKCTKRRLAAGFLPDPLGGYSASQRPLAGLRGGTRRGWEGRVWNGRGRGEGEKSIGGWKDCEILPTLLTLKSAHSQHSAAGVAVLHMPAVQIYYLRRGRGGYVFVAVCLSLCVLTVSKML